MSTYQKYVRAKYELAEAEQWVAKLNEKDSSGCYLNTPTCGIDDLYLFPVVDDSAYPPGSLIDAIMKQIDWRKFADAALENLRQRVVKLLVEASDEIQAAQADLAAAQEQAAK